MVSRTAVPFEHRVGQVLQEGGFITELQLTEAHELSRSTGKGLLDTLVSQGMLSQESLVTVLSFQLRVPVADLRHVNVDPEAVRLVPEDYARQHSVMPIGFDNDGSLRVATRMPNDFQLSAEMSSITGRQTKFVLAIGGTLEDLIDRVYTTAPGTRASPGDTVADGGADAAALVSVGAAPTDGAFGQDISQLPAVQAVDMVTLQAVRAHASDIHMVPTSDSARVLFRLDGELREMVVLPFNIAQFCPTDGAHLLIGLSGQRDQGVSDIAGGTVIQKIVGR